MEQNFIERLAQVLAERKPTPWGERLGFNKSTVSRIFSGVVPGSEILNAIMRYENISLSWLLSGKGDQFLIERVQTPAEFSDLLEAHTSGEIWESIYVCNAPNGLAVILTQPGRKLDYKGKELDYTVIEVINGPVDSGLVEMLKGEKEIGDANACHSNVYLCQLEEQDAWNLSNGFMGTFALLGDNEYRGLLEVAESAENVEDLLPTHSLKTGEQPVDTRLMRGVIELVDNVIIEEGIQLDTAVRARIITAAYRSAEKKGEVDPITISAIIEAASD